MKIQEKMVPAIPDEAVYLTTQQVARYLQLSERTIKRYVKSGEIPSRLFGGSRRVLRSFIEPVSVADSKSNEPAYLTVQQVADRLQLKVRTVVLLVQQGKIPSLPFGGKIRIPTTYLVDR